MLEEEQAKLIPPSVLQVPIHVFLDLSTLECTHLSEPKELFILDLMNTHNNYPAREVMVSDILFHAVQV